MRPSTKLHHEIIGLKSHLPKLTLKHKQWAYSRDFEKLGALSRGRVFCLECGSSRKALGYLIEILDTCECPDCHARLKVKPLKQIHYKEGQYMAFISRIKNFQVVRMAMVTKYFKKNHASEYGFQEVMQHWIREDGKYTMMSIGLQTMCYEYDRWSYGSDMAIRQVVTYNATLRYEINPCHVYPYKQILPILKRNGFNGNYTDIAPHILFQLLLTDPIAETLYKVGQYSLLYYRNGEYNVRRFDEHWNLIKICLRHNYIVTDAKDWMDYVQLLREFGKDVHNPKYLCPADFHKAHNQLVKRKNRIILNTKIKELKGKMRVLNENYRKDKKAFLDLSFSDGPLHIEPLKNVREFLEEGTELGHCVFSNEYFKQKRSLLLSAKIDKRRIETVEVYLPSLSISQARGAGNKPTQYHDQIVDLVTRNLPAIAKKVKLAKAEL